MQIRLLLENTKLSRAEMRAEILINHKVPLATYIKVEQQTLNETYSAWIANLVRSPRNTNRECLENLARLLDKNMEDDVQIFIRKQKEEEFIATERRRRFERIAKIKKILWGVTAGLIILQIVFWGWWTILTGLITLAIAGYIHYGYLD